MSDLKARWEEMLRELERERDELRVQMHLAKADARDEWDKLEERIDELRARVKAIDTEGDGYLDDIGNAARDMGRDVAAEVRAGFERLRKLF